VSRDRDGDRALRTSSVQRDVDRRTVARRDDDRRAAVQRRDRDHDDRDRSRYVRRHDHHSHDWFHTHGWWYDRDYWYSNRVHRYYNDSLGVYIINPTGPSYADGYSDYYGFDYESRIAVQQALAEMGYYNGPIDGVIGAGTRNAIARYQSDYGLAVTGNINNSLMQSLRLM
jgi:ABC-type Zn2+ transport system substrate-binding protein/surface adhesin